MEYLSAFVAVCVSSWVNFSQCVKVWEYMPGYIVDYYELKVYGPYYREKAIKNDIIF